jgi:hypothetical protein
LLQRHLHDGLGAGDQQIGGVNVKSGLGHS